MLAGFRAGSATQPLHSGPSSEKGAVLGLAAIPVPQELPWRHTLALKHKDVLLYVWPRCLWRQGGVGKQHPEASRNVFSSCI